MRTVRTKSGATAVQIVWSSRRGARSIEHVGSAHDAVELQALKTAAARRLSGGQQALDLDVGDTEVVGVPLEIISSRMACLWDGLCAAYVRLGLDRAAGGDEVFRDLVMARIIEPTSKADSLRVLAETGVATVSYRTLTRHLPKFAAAEFGLSLSKACAAQAALGPTSLVLYDVITLLCRHRHNRVYADLSVMPMF